MTAATVDTFFEGGSEAAKFEDKAYGTIIGGRIVETPRMVQQRDYTSGDPIFYPDGNPAMQMVVTVQAFDPTGDDDGKRSFYIKGQMKQAVGDALKKAGEKSPRLGGLLRVKYIEDKPTTLKNGRPGNPQKIYAAQYTPPADAAAGSFFDGPTAAVPGTPAGGNTDPRMAVPAPPGVDPAAWAAMNGDQRAQMLQALGIQGGNNASQYTDEPPF